MTRPPHKSVSIAPNPTKAPLSKGQRAFNTLIQQIQKKRNRLAAWDAIAPTFQKKYVDELLPLERASMDLQVKRVYQLSDAYDQKGLTISERRMIAELITGMAGELIEEHDDAQLKAIYNRHSQSDDDSEAAAEREDMKSAREAMRGVERGDDIDMSSPEEVLRRAHARVEEQQAQEAAENQARKDRRAKRKKSAKQLAEQARQEAEQAESSLSIREVYRKLASALHPDREPDPEERLRKTALMQRVNQAYDKNNLLLLLELQLELEHIDQSVVNNLSDDRLKHYNSILKEQLRELDQEMWHVEARFRHTYGIPPFVDLSPDTVVSNLAADIAELQQTMRNIEDDLFAFEDVKKLKSWLKDMKRRQAARRFEDMPF
jgi:hypothetical protein